MTRDPLRVLILLPLILASLYVPTLTVPRAAGNINSTISLYLDWPSMPFPIITHSLGPAEPYNHLTVQVAIDNVGPVPEDLEAWQVHGKLNPKFFTIQSISVGHLIDTACLNEKPTPGETLLPASFFEPATGEFAASVLCAVPGVYPNNRGFTGSGVLMTLNLLLRGQGSSTIDLFSDDTYAVDIDNDGAGHSVSSRISLTAVDGLFNNTPTVPRTALHFNGNSATVSPRNLGDKGDCVRLHANVRQDAPNADTVIVDFRIKKSNGVTESAKTAPFVPGDTGNSVDLDYCNTDVRGLYRVSAFVVYTEDGGLTYPYQASEVQSKNLDFQL